MSGVTRIPASVQGVIDQHNSLVSDYSQDVSNYNSDLALAQSGYASGDIGLAWGSYQAAQSQQSSIDMLTPKIQGLESQIPGLIETYGDQYQQGKPLVTITDTTNPNALHSPFAAPSSQSSGVGSLITMIAFLGIYVYLRRSFI